MIEMETLLTLAKEVGFTQVAPLDPATIELKQEVRDMCANNTCGQYAKRWSCPPGCGELDEMRKTITQYSRGILVQMVGELEDDFDVETMMETQEAQKENLAALQDKLLELDPNGVLVIGSGCCKICKTCTYPDAPCRFPDRQVASMEAYGMLVTEVCQANNMKYYYGPGTLAYTSCVLVK